MILIKNCKSSRVKQWLREGLPLFADDIHLLI